MSTHVDALNVSQKQLVDLLASQIGSPKVHQNAEKLEAPRLSFSSALDLEKTTSVIIGHFGAENGFAIGTIEALQAMVSYQAPAYTSQLSFSWHEQVILGGRPPCQKSHQCVHIIQYD